MEARRSSGGSSGVSSPSLSAPLIAQWFRLWLLFHSLFSPQRAASGRCVGLHKVGFGGRTGKNFGRFIFAFFNSIDHLGHRRPSLL
jgi:hypothetical protein